MRMLNILHAVAWGEEHFGSIMSGGDVRKRDLQRAERAGLVRCVGMVPQCDGDGFLLEPERYRAGYELTDAGREMLRSTTEEEG